MNNSKNTPREWAIFVFNLIAPLYRKLDLVHNVSYIEAIERVNSAIPICNKRILDVGAGAGDWGAMFQLFQPSEIIGIDFAERMVSVAKEKHPQISFSFGNAEDLSQFANNSFDVVTASYVVHGVKQESRERILAEVKRVSSKYVVLHDFHGKTPLFIQFLEFLERSDYKTFKLHIKKELAAQFNKVESIEIKQGSGIYIAEK